MRRIMIKISGEAMSGDKTTGFDEKVLNDIYEQIAPSIEKKIEICILLGGGNFISAGSTGPNNYSTMVGEEHGSSSSTSTSGTIVFDVSQYTGYWSIRPTFSYVGRGTFTKVWLE